MPGIDITAAKQTVISLNCVFVSGEEFLHFDRLPRFFEFFTTFQLFRLPDLQKKLRRIPTPTQRTTLLAAMLAFGLKGLDRQDVNTILEEEVLAESTGVPSIHFRGLGIKYLEKAMTELGDEPLSLPLLQAMILHTQCLLVQGVRGRAWRYLGTCIRSAYELNLHLIDAGKRQNQDKPTNSEQWCVEEEWRRAWWAIWEMDVFASVIRRCPAGIDWAQNETFLPAEDEKWYSGEPQQSCVLDRNIVARWKSLAATKSKSSKAWYIVITSLMKDAQTISSPNSIDRLDVPNSASSQDMGDIDLNVGQRQRPQKNSAAVQRLGTVLNSLYCAVMALPRELKYQGQYLDFGGKDVTCEGAVTQRLTHSFQYSIYMMTQLTKLLALKYHVFRSGIEWSSRGNLIRLDNEFPEPASPPATPSTSNQTSITSQYLAQYFEAADNVVNLVGRCCEDHYRYINSFHISTTWMAGAVQLLHRSQLPEDSPDRDLSTSNFELLSMTYQKAVEFWNMSKVPLRNWEALESHLEGIQETGHSGKGQFHYDTPCTFTGGSVGGHRLSSQTTQQSPHVNQSRTVENSTVEEIFRYLTGDSSTAGALPEQSNASQPRYVYGASSSDSSYAPNPPPLLDPIPGDHQIHPLGNMTVSDPDLRTHQISSFSGSGADPGPQIMFSPEYLDAGSFVIDHSATTMDFPSYLEEVFSGAYLP